MGYKVLLFDFDGTVCDSHDRSLRIVNNLAEEFHFKKISLEEMLHYRGKPLKEVLSLMEVPLFRVPAIVLRAKKKFFDEIDSLKPIEGITSSLETLKNSGFEMGIVTSNSKSNVERFLERHQIPGFKHIRGDSSLFGKGRVLTKLVKELGISSKDTIYIGDETRDIEAAKVAKMKVISVTWGYNSKKILEQNNPDFIVETPAELVATLQRME